MSHQAESSGRRAHVRLGGAARVWLLTSGLAAAAAALYFGVVIDLDRPATAASIPWWVFVAFFFAAEAHVVHFHFRREAHTFSISELGVALGLFCIAPWLLVVAHLSGALLALTLRRRQRTIKLAFNLSQFALSTCVALVTFHALTGTAAAGDPRAWLAAFAAVVLSSLVGVVAVTVVISLAEGQSHLHEFPQVAAVATLGSIADTSIALLAVELLRTQPVGLGLLVVPVAAVVLAFYAYSRQRARHEHLEFLYDSMRTTHGTRDIDVAVQEILRSARRMFRAEHAEIVLFTGAAADRAARCVSASTGEHGLIDTELSQQEQIALAVVVSNEQAVLLPKGRGPDDLDGLLGARSLKDGMLAALRNDSRVIGMLLVGDRAGDVSTFGTDDAKLLETFAGHASLLLENDQLEESLAALRELQEQLRYQAYHDALTGLPNRTQLAEQLAHALESGRAGATHALLFLDLDDFKTINDSLGHAIGDRLLGQVGDRIRACLRPGDVPARLGGDEFAVVIRDALPGAAEEVAVRLVQALRTPFALAGREFSVRCSVGIAIADSATLTVDELLRRADVAMYNAKAAGKDRYSRYEPAMDDRVKHRHELGVALDGALDRCEISLRYQPIVRLEDGRAIILEALVRWRHPQHGFVEPNDFLPLAETSGLIIPLTRYVLRGACEAVSRLDGVLSGGEGESLCVSVNVSPTSLQSTSFVRDVTEVLGLAGLDASRLILEVTETGLMRDPARTGHVLRALNRLGVQLALDDFGTGHSSLDRLRDFPVTMIKIAKPFVDRLADDPPEATFVEASLRLGEALGVNVVAEGIEQGRQVTILRELGCELGQGFWFARPLEQAGVGAFLSGAVVPLRAGSRQRPRTRAGDALDGAASAAE